MKDSMDKIEKLKSFLMLTPEDPFLKHALALEYIKAGDEPFARDLFIEILNRDPSYIGSYYHLAKLLERAGDTASAKIWYEKGLIASRQADDSHTYNELQTGLEELING